MLSYSFKPFSGLGVNIEEVKCVPLFLSAMPRGVAVANIYVEKLIYGDNSTKRYRNILRHELELKWIKLLQTPHPLGFNDNIYHEGNISRLPDFDVFFSFRYP